MRKRKVKRTKQVITDPEALEAIIHVLSEQIRDQYQIGCKAQEMILKNQDLIKSIKQTGKYTQIIETNIK